MTAHAIDLIPKNESFFTTEFLLSGLKIVQICFESELNAHWQKIAKIVKDVSKVAEARQSFWSYLEFLVSYRNPLFIILLPFLQQKVIIAVEATPKRKIACCDTGWNYLQVSQPAANEIEKAIQQRVKERLTSFSVSPPICRSALVVQLKNELRDLRIELDNKKIGKTLPVRVRVRLSLIFTTLF